MSKEKVGGGDPAEGPVVAPMQDRFRGAMVGAVVGDCLGADLEFRWKLKIDHEKVARHFDSFDFSGKMDNSFRYTDDTAMARQLAESIIAKEGVELMDLARRSFKDYMAEPWRSYGAGAKQTLLELERHLGPSADPTVPARAAFGGKGSYGNGAAMRVHPVALLHAGGGGGGDDVAGLVADARTTASFTHAHKDGFNGAVLQAHAVRLALEGDGGLSNAAFLRTLKDLVSEHFGEDADRAVTYAKKLDHLLECLETSDDKLAQNLGNDVAAKESVPLAIYCALRFRGAQDDENVFERVLRLCYSYGGDTDTIGSMAGAIAGAYLGERSISSDLKRLCEGVGDARRQADRLYKLVQSREGTLNKL